MKKIFLTITFFLSLFFVKSVVAAGAPLDHWEAHPPIHVRRNVVTSIPTGLTPAQIRTIYNLPSNGGAGTTIAIIDAYDYPTAQNDLNVFSSIFGLPQAVFEKKKMASNIRADGGWALEAALDTQWAHAIAPNAKILLVEAKSNRLSDLLSAVDYARKRSDVVAISMSWGGNEFSGEASYDKYFTSSFGANFFASSGDSGNGVSWPAVSPNVIGVGGTTLNFDANNNFTSETAWNGSGGGKSLYMVEPIYQQTYNLPQSLGKRGVPDVSYNADPNSGVAVYDSTSYQGQTGWYQVGGTSAGAPQWAAIRAVYGSNVNLVTLYQDAKLPNFFRDIVSGSNGSCGFYCNAMVDYDYVTGLGSPLSNVY